jgi:hypothetical protein
MLENGTQSTIVEIATAEKINESYVGRVLRLTLLAPEVVWPETGSGNPRHADEAAAGAVARAKGGPILIRLKAPARSYAVAAGRSGRAEDFQ